MTLWTTQNWAVFLYEEVPIDGSVTEFRETEMRHPRAVAKREFWRDDTKIQGTPLVTAT